MWGMRYPIDVISVDRRDRIVAVHRQVRPGRIAGHWRAVRTIELPAGALDDRQWIGGVVTQWTPRLQIVCPEPGLSPRVRDRRNGQALVEYALIILLVALAVLAALGRIAPITARPVNTVGTQLQQQPNL